MVLAPTLTLSAGSGAAIVRPTFSRDFAGEKTLNNGTGPSITFTRASDATYFDADGVLRFAPNNHIRNSEAGGSTNGVIGSGGVMPTNWVITANANGITSEIIGTGTENGLAYIDIKVSGTPTSNGSVYPTPESSTQISASSGQTWTFSTYCKLAAGSLSGATVRIYTSERASGGADLANTGATLTPTTASLASQRSSVTRTFNNGSTNFALGFLEVAYTSGNPIDLTLRIAAPQLERGSSATAYNPTTGTAFFGPRFDHDPATAGNPSRGLLIEESRQNLLQRSEEFENAYWSNIDATVSANAATSPAATLTADRVYPSTNSAASVMFRNVAASASAAYSASVFVKAAGKTFGYLQINFNQTTTPIRAFAFTLNLSNGSLGSQQDLVGATTGVTATATSVGSGWYRLSLSFTTTALTDGVSILFGPCDAANDRTVTASGTDGIFAWGAQLEAGAFPTSYIPTTTAAVTRSADSAVVTPISSFYNASEGTLFAEANPRSLTLQPDVSRVFASLNSGDFNNQINIQQRTSGDPDTVEFAPYIFPSGGPASMAGGGSLLTTTQRVAGAYKSNDFAASFNGGSAVTESSGSVPSGITHLHIGLRPDAGTGALSGHIRKIAYWPKRLTNTLLEQLTT